MTLAIVYSRASSGMSAPLVTVEVHISRGTQRFLMVGLPETAVKESRQRVRSAIFNSQLEFPKGVITVNLAPADLKKEGSRFDLPIALGILAAGGLINKGILANYEFTGELALSGELRPVRAVLPIVLGCHQSSRTLILPRGNAQEASLAKHIRVLSARHLLEVYAHLRGRKALSVCSYQENIETESLPDLSEVKGQQHAKRALEIAAAGRHSLLMVGPPGTGKTLLASRLPSILPELTEEQALDAAALASLSKTGFKARHWRQIPFRSPHHTTSAVALVGGSNPPRPGEVSLAHQGVLFLDELPEFNRNVLECLREPLESKRVSISRAAHQCIFPADFQMIAAMNPCPCGYAGSRDRVCECGEEQIKRYMAKISGPLLDRIDMQIEVPKIPADVLTSVQSKSIETSKNVRARVIEARTIQISRQHGCNASLRPVDLEKFCELQEAAKVLLQKVMLKAGLSARAYHRILKLARTIADLSNETKILDKHVAEALNYRCFDRSKGQL